MGDPVPLRPVPTAASDPVGSLRRLADRIEAGELGDIRAICVLTLKTEGPDRLGMYGYGRDGEPGWINLMLGLAMQRLQRGIDP